MPRTSVIAAALLALLTVPACTKQSEAAGRGGTMLALKDPSDQTITQGSTNDVSISVDRHGFADAVQISFSNLPTGIRVEETAIPAGESQKQFRLIAAPDAQIVNKQIVTVTAKGAGATPTQTFELTVKAK
jgi:hypothetical protein